LILYDGLAFFVEACLSAYRRILFARKYS